MKCNHSGNFQFYLPLIDSLWKKHTNIKAFGRFTVLFGIFSLLPHLTKTTTETFQKNITWNKHLQIRLRKWTPISLLLLVVIVVLAVVLQIDFINVSYGDCSRRYFYSKHLLTFKTYFIFFRETWCMHFRTYFAIDNHIRKYNILLYNFQ